MTRIETGTAKAPDFAKLHPQLAVTFVHRPEAEAPRGRHLIGATVLSPEPTAGGLARKRGTQSWESRRLPAR